MSFDLDAYLERIGYADSLSPTLATFKAIHRRQTEAIPFENVSPLLHWPVTLDIDSLQQKMVRDGRGGYCFEQNLLLWHALEAIGFDVTGLSARVLSNQAPGVVRPRSHMLLLVAIGKAAYIADAGFGGMTLTGPIRLQANTVQTTPHEKRRLVCEGDEYIMQAEIRGEWTALYQFDLRPSLLPDYEMANWYVSTHPSSHFTKNLTVARPTAQGRYTLRNNEFAMHDLAGGTERTVLTTPGELRAVLEETFLIRLPNTPKLDTMLERLAVSVPNPDQAS